MSPIKIGDVVIRPGDVEVGDIDRGLVVPHDIAYAVLLRADEIPLLGSILVIVYQNKNELLSCIRQM